MMPQSTMSIFMFMTTDLGVHLDPAGGCLVQLGGKDRVQKRIAGADKLTGAGMELQLVPDPGGVVQGLSRFPGGQEGLESLPVVLHIMTQLPVLAFPPLDGLIVADLLIELLLQIFPLQALTVDPGGLRHQQDQVIKDQQKQLR